MKHFYLRNDYGLPLVCVAAEVRPDTIDSQVAFSLSRFNPKGKDKFAKHVARDVAIGRLKSGLIDGQVENTGNKTMEGIVEYLKKSAKSRTVRKLAKRWLKNEEELRLKRLKQQQDTDYTT